MWIVVCAVKKISNTAWLWNSPEKTSHRCVEKFEGEVTKKTPKHGCAPEIFLLTNYKINMSKWFPWLLTFCATWGNAGTYNANVLYFKLINVRLFILFFHICSFYCLLNWLTCKVELFAINDNDNLIVIIEHLISLCRILCFCIQNLCQNLIIRILNRELCRNRF